MFEPTFDYISHEPTKTGSKKLGAPKRPKVSTKTTNRRAETTVPTAAPISLLDALPITSDAETSGLPAAPDLSGTDAAPAGPRVQLPLLLPRVPVLFGPSEPRAHPHGRGTVRVPSARVPQNIQTTLVAVPAHAKQTQYRHQPVSIDGEWRARGSRVAGYGVDQEDGRGGVS